MWDAGARSLYELGISIFKDVAMPRSTELWYPSGLESPAFVKELFFRIYQQYLSRLSNLSSDFRPSTHFGQCPRLHNHQHDRLKLW